MTLLKPTLSVVIPSNHLDADVSILSHWILNSDLTDCQIVIVVDEETRNFGKQVDELRAISNSNQMEIIRGEFGSPGSARNAGLLRVHGQWVAFWDSDDIPNPAATLRMVAQAELVGADLAIGAFSTNQDGIIEVKKMPRSTSKPSLILHLSSNPGIWRFCMRTDLVGSQQFNTSLMGEDQIFLSQLKLIGKTVLLSSENIYTYTLANERSLTQSRKAVSTLGASLDIMIKLINSKKTNQLAPAFLLKMYISLLIRNIGFTHKPGTRNLLKKGFLVVLTVIRSLTSGKQNDWEILL